MAKADDNARRDRNKVKISITLDPQLVEEIDELSGIKRSTLFNELGWEWLEKNNYAERP